MIKVLGHPGILRRVAINVGAGFVPGTNAVVMARPSPREIGMGDGRHPGRVRRAAAPGPLACGGWVTLSPQLVRTSTPPPAACWPGARSDPIYISQKEGQAVDLSGEV